jgi:hypothetical protein
MFARYGERERERDRSANENRLTSKQEHRDAKGKKAWGREVAR